MQFRTPLAAAVAGALLMGGAATGTTLALWHGDAPLTGAMNSGAMSLVTSIAAGGSGTATLQAGAPAASTLTVKLADTSKDGSKNLQQDVRVSTVKALPADSLDLSQLRLGVVKRVPGEACSTAIPSTGVEGYTSPMLSRTAPAVPDETFEVCISLAANDSAQPASGMLVIEFEGRQIRPDGTTRGWTTTSDVSIATKTIAAPVRTAADPTEFKCAPTGNTSVNLTWTAPTTATPDEYRLRFDNETAFRAVHATSALVLLTDIPTNGSHMARLTAYYSDAGESTGVPVSLVNQGGKTLKCNG